MRVFKRELIEIPLGRIAIAFIVMFLFSFTKSVRLPLSFPIWKNEIFRVPLSSLIFFIITILWLIKIVIKKRVNLNKTGLTPPLLLSGGFLTLLTILFYFILRKIYQMDLKVDLNLLSQTIQYIVLFFILTA